MTKELDYIADLERENRLLGERCNQLLKDKGELTDMLDQLQEQNSQMFNTIALQEQQIEKMKCCENCKHKKGEVDRCELLMYSLNACLCKNKDKWELKE